MGFENTEKLLEILLSPNAEYDNINEIAKGLQDDIKVKHKRITGLLYPSALTQAVLECLKIEYGFKSSYWQSSKYLKEEDINPNESPICFSRLISKNSTADYSIYNLDQLRFDEATVEAEIAEREKKQKEQREMKEQRAAIKKNDYDREYMKKVILACVKEYNDQYGRTGIARILKGSGALKDNGYNTEPLDSKYFGIFQNATLKYIRSIIDILIEENRIILRKIMFGRTLLKINPEYEAEIDDINIPVNSEQNDETSVCEEDDDENILKVVELINNKQNVFITGHAGTGKSYILGKLKERFPEIVVTSTTGIAAVNVKGQTLHSWAGIGICNRPVEQVVEKIFSKPSVRNPIQKCKILAIDEISMLDIKTFEYTDAVLRQIRNTDEPFGGIQVIFIGDFYQLPPVETREDTQGKYCFESHLWNELNLNTVLLTKNYRQNEAKLIEALANMRINALTSDDIKLLKTRECRDSDEFSDVLHIFSTNAEADEYNNLKFRNIDSKEYKLYAMDGFYQGKKLILNASNDREQAILNRIDTLCTAEKTISLKVGARVMLLTNLDFDRGLINGSCGNVMEIDDDYVLVKFDNGEIEDVKKHDFEFYNNDKLIALRCQFPLRLAYGITIHKSQGMSLDNLFVDCCRIFEKGQAYVAISRIKTLDGLHLCNFKPSKVMVDEKVAEFYKSLDIYNQEQTEFVDIDSTEFNDIVESSGNDIDYYVRIIKDIISKSDNWITADKILEKMGINPTDEFTKRFLKATIKHIIKVYLEPDGAKIEIPEPTFRVKY